MTDPMGFNGDNTPAFAGAESLQPQTIELQQGTYVPEAWNGRNESAIEPFGEHVLILPDQPARSRGGIHFIPEMIERVAWSAETGVLIAAGESAWSWNADRSRRFEGRKPEPGTRVYFERYAGKTYHGIDGRIYRLMSDKSIGAEQRLPEDWQEIMKKAGLALPDTTVAEAMEQGAA